MPLNNEAPLTLYLVSVPAGIVSSLLLGTLWVSPVINQPNVDHDRLGVMVFCISALVELTVEPAWVLVQLNHYATLKVSILYII